MNDLSLRGLKKKLRLYRIKRFLKSTLLSSYLNARIKLSRKDESTFNDLITQLKPIDHQVQLVRVGSVNDGGYLLPKECFSVTAVFSAGVEFNSDFEYEFAIKGIPCFLADYSVEGPAISHSNFNFAKKFIGTSNSGNEMTLNDWLHKSNISGENNILSMDIEGSEYKILESIPATLLDKFSFITIELHGLAKILNAKQNKMIMNSVNNLKKNHHILHLHANNFSAELRVNGTIMADVIEISLARKDFFGGINFKTNSYLSIHEYDMPNDIGFRQYRLRFI